MKALTITLPAFLVLMAYSADGQGQGQGALFVTAGSTTQGDYLRGVGVAGIGMGAYNRNTAIANSINAQTAIKVNEYIYGCLMNENKMNAEHRQMIAQRAKDLMSSGDTIPISL